MKNAIITHKGTMTTRFVKMVIVLSFVNTLTACIFQSPPDTWPTPIPVIENKCPDLSGSYRNIGENAEGENAGPLTLKVFPLAAKNWTASDHATGERYRTASHVTFYGPNEKGLIIEAWKDDELIGRIERREVLGEGFSCNGGTLSVSLPVYATAFSGIFFDMFRSANLSPASDGSLLVKKRTTGAGLGFYVVPLVGQFEIWDLYPATAPDGKLNDG